MRTIEQVEKSFDKAAKTYRFALDNYTSDYALWEEQKNVDSAWVELMQARKDVKARAQQ